MKLFRKRTHQPPKPNDRRVPREQILLTDIDKQSLGLEIGPSHCPIAAKRDGFDVRVLDHLDAAGLREKYADHGVDVTAIEEVDYVWSGQPLEDLIGADRFAWIIASHVIEHVPDLVGFLNSCDRILVPGGLLSLAVPDKRYCFDCRRENTALGRVIDVALAKSTNHSAGTAAEYFLKVCRKGGQIAWGDGHTGDLETVHGLADALQAMARVQEGHYYDLHEWVFTPDSFRGIVRDLRDLRLIGLEEHRFHDTRGHEFFVTLRKPATPKRSVA
jgi:2-polyprenyl-3-methyl-5-hydroxy-6-metoxy-1,4-benzoquinol methylase